MTSVNHLESGMSAMADDNGPPLANVVRLQRTVREEDRASLAVDVLIIGTLGGTASELIQVLNGMHISCRATLQVDEALDLSPLHMPDVIVIDDETVDTDALNLVRSFATHRRLRDVPIIIVGGHTHTKRKVEAFSAGAVDYVCVPVGVEELVARIVTQRRLRRAQVEANEHSRRLEAFVLEQVSEITESQTATIIALAKLAESRDDQTGGHLERVQQYCRLLAMKLSEQPEFGIIDHTFIDNIECASALHDIGKVAISDRVLLKPGNLTQEEFELMQTHTIVGAQTLEAVCEKYPNNEFVAMGIKIARSHHEHWDGNGYPDGLVGEEIPLAARIMAVADVYDALMSERSYKRPLAHIESREIICSLARTQFDPRVVAAFMELEEEFAAISAG